MVGFSANTGFIKYLEVSKQKILHAIEKCEGAYQRGDYEIFVYFEV